VSGPGRHPFAGRWNHNTHYYPLLRAAIPDSASRLLDIGCGDGTLGRYLSSPSRFVVGVDVDHRLLRLGPDTDVHYVLGSAEALGFADASFDAVTMTAVLHHVDSGLALAEAARVLRPGGLLQVLGIGRYGGPRDLPHEVRDVLTHRLTSRGRRAWEPPTTKQEPTQTWAQTLATARRALPGCTWRRLPMWRYLLTWSRSATQEDPPC
jgi:ubiquinone/menaquinone biosynthesis C-methylase UbiE